MTDRHSLSHLITVDQLRAAGALDCPPSWRKSLSAGLPPKKKERDLFSDLSDDDDLPLEESAGVDEDAEDEDEDEDD